MNDLLKEARQAIHDLLLEIYARDGHLNERSKEIHDLLVKMSRMERS